MDSIDSGFESSEIRLELNRASLVHLYETAKWGTFLSILGFIFAAIILILSLFVGAIFSAAGRMDSPFPFPTYFIGILYALLGVVYFFPSYYLYQFSARVKTAVRLRSSDSIPVAMENLKSMFKFMGIMAIIMISLYILFIIIMLAVGAGALLGNGVNA